ncbi:MAG TPA: SDR family NAD(P)-dependent oxidoreductase [Acidimicrobiales bacterium]|nr:SDR family NAD(P)-dependent oxidoreductase [Acidimicrobiales bacterium]
MDLGITGRVALVTAASKGLGRASAVALAREGVKVALCARGRDALADAASEIADLGGEALAIPADVTEPEAPARVVATTVEHFGRLDILVANAGGPPPATALDVTDQQLADAVNANFVTSVRLVREAVPHMRPGGWGRICCIASSSVKQPIPGLALSNAARTALWAWAKTAAADLFPAGITLNLACPGLHATDRMKELGFDGEGVALGDPGDFGRIVAFLCSEPAAFLSGVALQVDGAATVGLL